MTAPLLEAPQGNSVILYVRRTPAGDFRRLQVFNDPDHSLATERAGIALGQWRSMPGFEDAAFLIEERDGARARISG